MLRCLTVGCGKQRDCKQRFLDDGRRKKRINLIPKGNDFGGRSQDVMNERHPDSVPYMFLVKRFFNDG